jgi:hypothetical protein
MPVWRRADRRRHARHHPGTAGTRVWLVTAVLFGEVLGGMVGIVEAPRHTDTVVERVEHSDEPADDDDRDPLVTWPLLGMVLGGFAGAATIVVARGVLRVRQRLSTSAATTDVGGLRQ